MGTMDLALVPATDAKNALALLPGSLGNFDAYVAAVNRIPMLLPEEEYHLARGYRDRGDLESAGKLVLSHLRLVVSVARNYLGYGLPHADLVQEGNIGLMKAVKRFDPDRGVRLVSFALHWIKAEIHEYVLRNWRLVKVATTKSQRKLFFNLRSLRKNHGTMSRDEIEGVARELNVKPEDVAEREPRWPAATSPWKAASMKRANPTGRSPIWRTRAPSRPKYWSDAMPTRCKARACSGR